MDHKRIFSPLLLLLLLCHLTGCRSSVSPPEEASPTAAAVDNVHISEVMTCNNSVIVDGQIGDWIELYNADDHTVSLGDYILSRESDSPRHCPLPERTLAPGEYVLLRCGIDLDYSLSRSGVTLCLSHCSGREVDRMSVPAMEEDQSCTREYGVVATPTPGAANSDCAARSQPVSGLFISEVLTSNGHYWVGSNGVCDLIELCWRGEGSIRLLNYYLSDSRSSLPGWPLPDITLHDGECAVIRCGDAAAGVPFSLSALGETLYLSSEDNRVIDALVIPELPYERSYGRYEGENRYFTTPSLGKPNTPGHACMSSLPEVSLGSGVYEQGFTVTLSGKGNIYYTTDGSTPTTRSRLYAGEEIPVEKKMSLRAFAVEDDLIPSVVRTWNYLIAPPDHNLDVVMVSTAPSVVSGKLRAGSKEESSANVALFVDGVEQFSLPCGISVLGSGSLIFDKKSFQISFRSRYGASALRYKLFDDREQDVFSAFNLRSGSQDQFYCNMRDELLTGLWGEFSDNVLIFAYRPVNLYLNGKYQGLYYLRERCNAETVAWHDNVNKSSVDILRSVYNTGGSHAAKDWGKVANFIRMHDLSVAGNYAYVASMLDIDSTIDYFLAQMWSTNYDLNNARLYRSEADGGRWRFILYDLDVAFYRPYANTVENLANYYHGMLKDLLAAPEFKERFTLRMGELLSGPLRDDLVIAYMDDFADMLGADLKRNCDRWKSTNDYEHFLYCFERMKNKSGVGVKGWGSKMIRQYIALAQPDAELRRRAFGEDYA